MIFKLKVLFKKNSFLSKKFKNSSLLILEQSREIEKHAYKLDELKEESIGKFGKIFLKNYNNNLFNFFKRT